MESAGEHFGSVMGTRSAGDFVLRLSRYPAGLKAPLHHHAHAYFSFIVAGRLRERCLSRERGFEAGSIHFHRANEPHSAHMGPTGLACMSIVPQGPLAQRLRALPERDLSPAEEHRLRVPGARCHAAFHETDAASDLMVEASALELVATLLREIEPADRQQPRWLGAVRDRLHDHDHEPIALKDLAAIAGVHPVHLVRSFRRHVGMTPGAYLRRLRLRAAEATLAGSELSIVEVALAAGYSSQAHFTRAFRREFGRTPGEARRRLATTQR